MNDELEVLDRLEALIAERREAVKRRDALEAYLAAPRAAVLKPLVAFFARHELCLKSAGTGRRPPNYQLAKAIWRGYDQIEPFLHAVVQQVNCNEPTFIYPAEELPPLVKDEKSALCSICENLQKEGFLEMKKGKNRLQITLKSRDTKFVNGGWGEMVTLYLVDKTLKAFTAERASSYNLFWNVRLTHPGETQACMELDVVAQVEDRVYIFETKTGEMLDVIKWAERTKRFSDHATFITCTPKNEINPKYFKPCRLIPFSKLEGTLLSILKSDFAE